MADKILRGVIVGASSLLGKELAEELQLAQLAVWDLKLLDGPEAGGQMAAAGDEVVLIQPVTREALAGADVVFLAGDPASTGEHGRWAHEAGASIVDLTGTLQGRPGVLLRSPWTGGGTAPDLATVAVSVPHPAALMLGTAAARLQTFGVRRIAATVLEPASQYGAAGVDELHQQTVGLLSFKPLEQTVFDAQVAFSLRAALGSSAKGDLVAATARISHEAGELAGTVPAEALTVQVLQAPVFHGTTASVFVELQAISDEAAIRKALSGEGLQVASADEPVSNDSVAGQGEISVAVRLVTPAIPSDQENQTRGTSLWLWMAADNLRLMARTAASCAAELAALRPASHVN